MKIRLITSVLLFVFAQMASADDYFDIAVSEGKQHCAANAESLSSAIAFLTNQTVRRAPKEMTGGIYTREISQEGFSGLFENGLIAIAKRDDGFALAVEVNNHVLVDRNADGLVDRQPTDERHSWHQQANSWNQYMFCRYVYTASRYHYYMERQEWIARVFPVQP